MSIRNLKLKTQHHRSGIIEDDSNHIRIVELEKRMELHINVSEAAIRLAANDLRARLDAMNEFRNALKDQAATFLTRNEMDHLVDAIHKDLKTIELKLSKEEGKASQISVNVSTLIAIIGLFIGIINFIIKK